MKKSWKEYLSLKSNIDSKSDDKIEKTKKIVDDKISNDDYEKKKIEKLSANSEFKFDKDLVETNQKLDDFWENSRCFTGNIYYLL